MSWALVPFTHHGQLMRRLRWIQKNYKRANFLGCPFSEEGVGNGIRDSEEGDFEESDEGLFDNETRLRNLG